MPAGKNSFSCFITGHTSRADDALGGCADETPLIFRRVVAERPFSAGSKNVTEEFAAGRSGGGGGTDSVGGVTDVRTTC